MARIRTIKPEFFTSEDIVALPPLARLLYIAMWCEADKAGRLAWKPKTFKMRYLPADSCDIEELCNQIVSAGLVRLYGDGLAFIPKFADHQHINPRETESKLPAPDASRTRRPRVSDAQGGREGKGREGTRDASRQDERFAEFYDAYPRKVGKADARKAFDKLKVDDELLALMLAAIATQKQGEQWRKNGGEFIPHPSTWLNGGRWEDGGVEIDADPYGLGSAL